MRTVLVACVALALVTAAGAAGVAADSVTTDEREDGRYGSQVIDAGETLAYDVQLGEGDTFFVVAQFDPADEMDVTLRAPGGEPVGESFEDDGGAGVELAEAPTNGTYTVEATNHGEATTFTLYTNHEIATVDAGATATYDVEVTEGDYFVANVAFDPADEIEVALRDPDGNPVGDVKEGESSVTAELRKAPTDGTYTVEVTNHGEAASAFFGSMHEVVRGASDSGSDDVPDPLEPGYYEGVEIGAGETTAYEAELSEGDYFFVVADFASVDEIEVALRDPDGDPVGDTFADDDVAYVELGEAPTDGAYTVEVENAGDEAATFALYVERDGDETVDPPEPDPVPEPLEEGYYLNQRIDAGETLTYDAEVTRGDLFVTGVESEHGDVEVTITDPDGMEVETETRDGASHVAGVVDAPASGTYTVAVENHGEATTFDLDVVLSETTAIEDGVHEGALEMQELDFYLIDLNAGDDLSIELRTAEPGALGFAVVDPNLDLVEGSWADEDPTIELADVEQGGTYVVQVHSIADDLVNYELDVDAGSIGDDADDEESDGEDDEPDDEGDAEDDGDGGDDEDADDSEGDDDDADNADEEGENGAENATEDDAETATEDEDDTDDDDGMPGLGSASALLGIGGMLALLGRNRSVAP